MRDGQRIDWLIRSRWKRIARCGARGWLSVKCVSCMCMCVRARARALTCVCVLFPIVYLFHKFNSNINGRKSNDYSLALVIIIGNFIECL